MGKSTRDMTDEERLARNEYARNWYAANKEKVKPSQRRYYQNNKERHRATCDAWKKNNAERYRDITRRNNRKRKHLPNALRPEPMLCECCGKTDTRALALDHCHLTNIFRGWLCKNCNLAIGRLGDSVEGVSQALNYLKRAYAGH